MSNECQEGEIVNFYDDESGDTWVRVKEMANFIMEEEKWVHIKALASQKMAHEEQERTKWDKMTLPEEYKEYESIFSKKESE